MTPEVNVEKLLSDEMARNQPPKRFPPLAAMKRQFQAFGGDRYQLTIPDIGVTLEIDRLRRESHELWGELSVRCELPGARSVDGKGMLSIADMNLSSARARLDRAKMLGARANTGNQLDWAGLIEEFCQCVLQADRYGQPSVDLRTVERPNSADAMIEVASLVIPKRHPTILFGDGGSVKSYLALYIAGLLAEHEIRVALFDWELDDGDHRDRLERLFPDGMPYIEYARCERPLVYEADRLRRIVRDKQIDFSMFDSIGYACDGPPESAEVAGRYFRAVRQIGGGSLHVAHVTKGEFGDQKPFGSVFWHNSARCTWYAQAADEIPDGSIKRLGLFNRKANLGALRQPVGFTVTFTKDQTVFRRSDVAGNPDLASKLTVAQRVTHLLRRGAMTVMTIAEELDLDVNTVTQTVNRYLKKSQLFIILDGKDTQRRIGLLERDGLS
jgi:hypothetical protein